MKSHRRKREEEAAAMAPHGRQLLLALSYERGRRRRLLEALAREKSAAKLAALENDLRNCEAVLAVREAEYAHAIEAAAAEKVAAQ
jgi:hypothetical protein